MENKEFTWTLHTDFSGHLECMDVDSKLALLREVVNDLADRSNGCIEGIENDLRRDRVEINKLKEANTLLNCELMAVRESFQYFNVSDDMDAEERIKYQHQFIQQEMEIINLRESNRQQELIIDKYRVQNKKQFDEMERIKHDMCLLLDPDGDPDDRVYPWLLSQLHDPLDPQLT